MNYFKFKWHKYCLEEEQIHEKRQEIYKDIVLFPMVIGRKPQISSKTPATPATTNAQTKSQASANRTPSFDDNSNAANYCKVGNFMSERSEEELDECSAYSFSKNAYYRTKNGDESVPINNYNNSELKSASTSSLNTASGFSNNNSEQRLNHSYQNGNHPLASLQPNRLRALTTYDSPNSPTPISVANNVPFASNYYSDNSYNMSSDFGAAQRNLISGSNQSLNKQMSLSTRPTSSSSNSSSQNFQQFVQMPAEYNANYARASYMQQMKISRQMTTPSPTVLGSLGLSSTDCVPISLPQRDYNYLAQKKN